MKKDVSGGYVMGNGGENVSVLLLWISILYTFHMYCYIEFSLTLVIKTSHDNYWEFVHQSGQPVNL